MEKIFVRAKPQKITVSETYYYETWIGDNSTWEFQKAEGEIKFKFPFDGVANGYFNKTALKDLQKQDWKKQAKKAQVGHLAIVKAGKTSWKQSAFEGRTIPIMLDVENIQQKLESSQEFLVQYQYRPDPPQEKPVQVGEVKLTDQDPFEDSPSSEYTPQYYPFPTLLINFYADIRGNVIDVEKLPQERIDALIKAVQNGQTNEVKSLPVDCSAHQICESFSDFSYTNTSGTILFGVTPDGEIESLEEKDEPVLLDRIASAILMNDPPTPIFTPAVRTVEDDEKKKRLMILIVPSNLSYLNDYGHSPTNDNFTLDPQLNESFVIKLLETRNEIDYKNTVLFQEEISSDNQNNIDLLAKVLVGLANTGEGYVIFGIRSKGTDYTVTGLGYADLMDTQKAADDALRLVKPRHGMICRRNRIFMERSDGKRVPVLILQITGDLSEAYSFRENCWQIEFMAKGWIVKERNSTETFDLFKKKYDRLLRRTVIKGEPPKISYGYLEWPYTRLETSGLLDHFSDFCGDNCQNLPGRSQAQYRREQDAYLPSKYDPLQSAMEWHDVPLTVSENSRFFSAQLQLEVRNPEELRDSEADNMTRDLPGYFEILLSSPLLSGLEITFFNALGEELDQSKREQILIYQTKIVLKIRLRTSDLFKKRDFSPFRQLEFEGVLPEPARYEDVREALLDCGLRATLPRDIGPVVYKGLPRASDWLAESRTSAGKFKVLLRIINLWYDIEREISYGERTDKKSVPSGRMTITIYGKVEGAENRDLTTLMNKLQLHLKERFKFVSVG